MGPIDKPEGTFLLDTLHEDEILAELDATCLRDGLLVPVPAVVYAARPQNDLSLWCVRRGFYCLPTLELIAFLRDQIGDQRAIEIGAGNGAIGRALGIPITDSRQQERPDIAAYYAAIGQGVTTYPPDVEKLTANQAIEKYEPEVVVAAWVTHRFNSREPERGGNFWGVDERWVQAKKSVSRYIFIGHERVHAKKPILSRRHATHRLPFLFGRSLDLLNVVWIWET